MLNKNENLNHYCQELDWVAGMGAQWKSYSCIINATYKAYHKLWYILLLYSCTTFPN